MKKFLGLMCALLIVVGLSGCGSNKASDDKLAQIKEAGKIVIGTNSGYPPYEFYDTSNGQKKLVGYDIAIGDRIGKELGVKVEWVDMDFEALIPSLMSGKIDLVLAGMVDNAERRKSVDFSEPYFKTQTVAVAKKANISDFSSAEKLKGKTIVAQTGTTQANAAKEVAGAELITLPNVSDTVASLTSGKADALFISEVSAKNIVASYPEFSFTSVSGINDDLLYDGASAAMAQGNDSLKEVVNKVINDLKDSGELDKLFNENVALYDKLN